MSNKCTVWRTLALFAHLCIAFISAFVAKKNDYQTNLIELIFAAPILSKANRRRIVVETIVKVSTVMRCGAVRSLACVGMSWRAEPSDDRNNDSELETAMSADAESFH